MFQPGNKFGRGRPKVSLTKPELLLPAIFANANINWGGDFVRLYKTIKERAFAAATVPLTPSEKELLQFFLTVMPYLCTKVQLKELSGNSGKLTDPKESVENARQTSMLLKALEQENGSRPSTTE